MWFRLGCLLAYFMTCSERKRILTICPLSGARGELCVRKKVKLLCTNVFGTQPTAMFFLVFACTPHDAKWFRLSDPKYRFCEDTRLAKRGLNKRGRPLDFISTTLFSVLQNMPVEGDVWDQPFQQARPLWLLEKTLIEAKQLWREKKLLSRVANLRKLKRD